MKAALGAESRRNDCQTKKWRRGDEREGDIKAAIAFVISPPSLPPSARARPSVPSP